MNEDRIAGTARNIGGKVEERVGRVTGNLTEQVRGKLDQTAGAAPGFVRADRRSCQGYRRHLRKMAQGRDRNQAVCGRSSCAWDRVADRKDAPSVVTPAMAAPCYVPETPPQAPATIWPFSCTD